ncbi:gamma-glutamyl kinase, partial [Staphylococcus aureus]|nr:gamma-glutamyl kinase [Staphylococcus aureus]
MSNFTVKRNEALMRNKLQQAKRIVIKVGTSSLLS